LALGNVIGSNLFNILLILGTSAVITPLSFQDIDWVDLSALALSALYLGTSVIVGRRRVVDRLDGVLFFLTWIAYMAYLIITL
jgi:cation:H+ antiporter